jgi:ubiquinone/menaquinone biosynthesis C-methylase UbiE
MSLTAFVAGHLSEPPSRVLEVGCGPGELALGLAALGYEVVAIDPNAPEGAIFRRMALEEFEADQPFEAVVASRSLHHIADLPGAVDRIAGLLTPGGTLVVNEHAWERMDEPTARWYLGHLVAHGKRQSTSLDAFPTDWRQEHAALHSSAALRAEFDRRFDERHFSWEPYLYGAIGEPSLEAEERRLIEAGELAAMGFRYVGARL